MTTDNELDNILAEIAGEHRETGAPQQLEAALFSAAEARKVRPEERAWQPRWTLAAAAILLAALAAGAVLWQAHNTHPPHAQQAHAPSSSAPTPTLAPASQPVLTSSSAQAGQPYVQLPVLQTRTPPPQHHAPRRHSSSPALTTQQPTWNALDEFVPLPASEGLPVAAELSVVRMRLRGSDLQQYGLQAPVEAQARSMLAEFVVGEDGLPRAIRIVR